MGHLLRLGYLIVGNLYLTELTQLWNIAGCESNIFFPLVLSYSTVFLHTPTLTLKFLKARETDFYLVSCLFLTAKFQWVLKV